MSNSADKENFKKQVNLFVDYHKKKQEQKESANGRNNLSLEEVIDRAPTLAKDSVEVLFDGEQGFTVSQEVVKDVRRSLSSMRLAINRMEPRRRFFILDTVNFFSSKIGLAKLMPALLVLQGDDQKKAIAEFIFTTYFSIQKNVETLLSKPSLYEESRAHIEKGELYLLVADISRIVIRLFKKDFLRKALKSQNATEFLLTAINPVRLSFSAESGLQDRSVYGEMIDNENDIRRIVLSFIISIQSHESLYTYAIKRYEYYKDFLATVPIHDRFLGVDKSDLSKILAGCFIANDQLKPNEKLISRMLNESHSSDEKTLSLIRQFVDELSPGTIYRLISRLKVSLQHISKTNFTEEFQEIQRFSVKSILTNVWTGFLSLVERGMIVITGPAKAVIQQVKRVYESFVYDERQNEESVKDGMIEKSSKSGSRYDKNLDAFSQMSQHFQLVETDVISYRGEHEGATFKDFGYNSHFYQKNESIMTSFLDCFTNLFSILAKDPKVREIKYQGHRNITEYYATYSFSYYLFCFGLTHIRNPKLPVIEEKSIFPYIFVMSETNTNKQGRILSRYVKGKNKKVDYRELSINTETAKLFYEPMYLILHLLPEYLWNERSTQVCIRFLHNQLKRIAQKGHKLLYVGDLD